MSASDKGVYKLVARNEKGEATSQVVEVTEIMEEGEKPKIISGLKSAVIRIYSSPMCSTFKPFIVTTIINIFLFRRSRKVNRSNLSPVCPNRIVKLPSHGTSKYIISTRNLFNLESIFIIIFIIFNNKYNNITIKVKYNNIYNINIYNTFIFFLEIPRWSKLPKT